MSRKILAQGDRDGACFLYSIANSYWALTHKQLTRKKWEKSVHAIPFKIGDFLSKRGTERLDENPEYFEGLCRDFLNQIQIDKFKISGKSDISEKSLRRLITSDQVVIVAIQNGDHWVTIVDVEERSFDIACSATALYLGPKYRENKSKKFGRTYNNKLSFQKLKLWDSYAILVKRISDV